VEVRLLLVALEILQQANNAEEALLLRELAGKHRHPLNFSISYADVTETGRRAKLKPSCRKT
jgi:hypothetical protein